MFPTSPYLRIRRPSPTTAEFKVSTLPPLTLGSHAVLGLLQLARLLLGLDVLLILYAKWTLSPYRGPFQPYHAKAPSSLFSFDVIWHAAYRTLHSAPGRLALRIAGTTAAWILVPLGLVVLYFVLLRIHTEESLLVLRGLGIQTSSTPKTVLGNPITRFIPTEKIQDVLINEAFLGFGVRYYLVVVVEGEGDLVVVFPKLLPRRDIVEKVWKGVRGCLMEEGNQRLIKRMNEKGY